MGTAIPTYDKAARIPMSEYYESRNDLEGLPVTTLEKIPVTNMPNIFSYSKGFTYGGKDDPILLALAQSDWPAPGEITSPWANVPIVPGDCRGSHGLHIFPVPLNWQTSFWSGPILSAVTLSLNIHTGRIGAISDQFALGTPWDWVRQQASASMIQFRTAHGTRQPATLHEDELEYQEGWKERKHRLEKAFEVRPVHTNGAGVAVGQGA